MKNRRFARRSDQWLVVGGIGLPLALLALNVPGASPIAQAAGPSSFRYVDESFRLPEDTNPPATDTLDVDFVDVDGDGDLDLFVAEGTASAQGRANKLYINDGRGFFADESAQRLPASPLAVANSTEVEFADVDADGDPDAIVANLGPEQLLLNDGRGFFADASQTNLPPAPRNFLLDISAEARFADVDADGDPDILVSNENPFSRDPLAGVQNRLWINDGAGRFTDETTTRLPARTDQTQGMVPGDIDGDGDLDLIVVNIGQDFVLINDGNGHFSDQTAGRFPVTNDATRKGVLADFNGDGTLDLFLANSRDQQNRLYFNNGRGVFTDVTAKNLPARADTTTSVSVADLDDDGDLDLFLTNAGAFQAGHGFEGDQSIYLRNNGRGKFQDKTHVYFPEAVRPSTDAEFGDVDGDGDLDLMIGNSTDAGGAEALYIRVGNPGKGKTNG